MQFIINIYPGILLECCKCEKRPTRPTISISTISKASLSQSIQEDKMHPINERNSLD